ncbi:hypothetical protein [Streptomyces sp. NBC_01477]|uniref:hypothetical protein n=1 Tax=Streptomyces sp. NBC_01477 TaxID=2976015 RepID=UPI002E3800D8|nr:hypothetical protein [Streptomyces sp. NBC_01477]
MNGEKDSHAQSWAAVPPSEAVNPWELRAAYERIDRKLDLLSGLVNQVNDHERRIVKLEQQCGRIWGSSLIRVASMFLLVALDDLNDRR